MQTAILLYPGLTMLDAIGPYQVLSLVPGDDVVLCASEAGRLSDDNALVHLDVEHTLDEVTSPDVVVVPGGFGTRRLAHEGSSEVRWLRSVHEGATWTTSVCTGSLLLGAAGLLRGRPATTHWHHTELLAAFGATPVPDRVVFDDGIVTAAGVSSGIDMALALVDAIHGPELAQAIQLGIEYDPQPPHDCGAPWKAPEAIVELVRSVMDGDGSPD